MILSKTLLLSLLLGFFISCSDSNETEDPEFSTERNSDNEKRSDDNECGFEDGTYSATVDYSNSETDYSQTYILDVEVENCEVVQINFPRGGWLDSDHLTPSELDSDGSCTLEGEDGKTYEIQIDD